MAEQEPQDVRAQRLRRLLHLPEDSRARFGIKNIVLSDTGGFALAICSHFIEIQSAKSSLIMAKTNLRPGQLQSCLTFSIRLLESPND